MQKAVQLIPPEKCAHRAALSAKEQTLYDKIAEAMSQRKCSVTVVGPFREDVGHIFTAILHDQPFLFDVNRTSVRRLVSIAFSTVSWEFYLSDAEYEENRKRICQELNRLKQALPKGRKLLQRELDVHNLLQKMKIQPDRSNNPPWWTHSIFGPLLHRRAVCEGVAQLFYLLCTCSGVPCQVICGVGHSLSEGSGPHAWNVVRLGSVYAHVDAYWDICHAGAKMGVCYDYFNLSDNQIRRDHSWDAVKYPVCMTEKYSWFMQKKLEADTLDQYAHILTRCRDAGLTRACVRFRKMPVQSEIQQTVETVLFSDRSGSMRFRLNEQQGIVHLEVSYS